MSIPNSEPITLKRIWVNKRYRLLAGLLIIMGAVLCVPHLQTRSFAIAHHEVWVNTNTGVYHGQYDHWYGHTVFGEYLPEGLAKSLGYRASRHR